MRTKYFAAVLKGICFSCFVKTMKSFWKLSNVKLNYEVSSKYIMIDFMICIILFTFIVNFYGLYSCFPRLTIVVSCVLCLLLLPASYTKIVGSG